MLVNSSAAIWRHRSDGTKPLPEPMLTSRGGVLWHSHERNFTSSVPATILYDELESYTLSITATSPSGPMSKIFRIQWCKQMSLKWIPSGSDRPLDTILLPKLTLLYHWYAIGKQYSVVILLKHGWYHQDMTFSNSSSIISPAYY